MVEQNTLEIIETVSQMNIKNGLIFLKSYLQYITLKKNTNHSHHLHKAERIFF